jgi:hypothetical protein
MKTDRVKAFEDQAKALLINQGILVTSRIISLDSLTNIVSRIHVMIGAPKKKEEESDVKPLERLQAWLNGEDVAGFPVTVSLKPVEDALTLVPVPGSNGEDLEDETEDDDGS